MTTRNKINHHPAIKVLTQKRFKQGVDYLCNKDTDLGDIVSEIGPPVMKIQEPGFPALIRMILEQQVSLASARAAYHKLIEKVNSLTPSAFLKLDDASLKTIGFSRQKTIYGRNLAHAIVKKQIIFTLFKSMDDMSVRSELIKIKGIGVWTADIFLLAALRRQDIWPSLDLALAVAAQKVKRLKSRPKPKELDAIGMAWQPWRAVAARILWHYYLSGKM